MPRSAWFHHRLMSGSLDEHVLACARTEDVLLLAGVSDERKLRNLVEELNTYVKIAAQVMTSDCSIQTHHARKHNLSSSVYMENGRAPAGL